MSRDAMLGAIRRGLKRGKLEGEAAAPLEARLAQHRAGVVPGRGQIPHADQVALFKRMAQAYHCSIAEATTPRAVPALIADYLTQHNLPSRAVAATDALLDQCDFSQTPLLELRCGAARDQDAVSITSALGAVAETGTMVFTSGPDHPTTLNLLPETHIVVLRKSQVVGTYEQMLAALRARYGEAKMPRTVNTVTGPSRTGDIEQTMLLGAHGPRRMHVVLVDG